MHFETRKHKYLLPFQPTSLVLRQNMCVVTPQRAVLHLVHFQASWDCCRAVVAKLPHSSVRLAPEHKWDVHLSLL